MAANESTRERIEKMSIILDHVNYVYGADTPLAVHALNDVCLKIPDGQFIGIIGHTGSGKSTLMQHMNGLIRATDGHIYFNGEEIIGLSYYEQWHETYNDLKSNLYDLTERYRKPICVCEYGANKKNIKMINDIVRSLPNGLGYGTMAWEPTRVLFDKEGNADKDLFGIYDALYKQYIKSDVQPVYEPPYVNTDTIQKPIIGADISWLPNQEQRGIHDRRDLRPLFQ